MVYPNFIHRSTGAVRDLLDPPTAQDRGQIDALPISPAQVGASEIQLKATTIQTAISVLPAALFCWELPLLFPVGN